MSGIHDVQFPMRLALGAVGGPERRTEILSLASGREVRNSAWAQARRRWDVGGAVSDLADLHALLSFFEARQGRLYGFRFRDPMDHASAPPGASISPDDQILGVGDDVRLTFQLTKDYGGTSRTITRPVPSSLRVALNGIEQVSGWTLDADSGQVNFAFPPVAGEVVSAGFEFDCPVRFESDRLEGVIEAFGAGRIVSVGLIELIQE